MTLATPLIAIPLLAAALAGTAWAAPPAGASRPGQAAAALPQPAQGGRHGACPFAQGAGGPAGWPAFLDELRLTGEQRQAIQAVLERYRTRGWDLAQRGSGIRDQFMAVAPDAPGYATAVAAASESTAAIAADAVRLLGEMRAEVYGVLTDDQKAQLRDKMQQQRDRWAEWRSRHQAPQP